MVNNIDCGNNVDLITIDLCKAFDSIPHNKLIHKLSKYGIIGKILNCISSFLNNRVFNVRLNSEYSNPYPVLSSVPQGSCLGPYLYVLFVNDATKIFKFAKLVMYADDMSLYAGINNENDYKAFQDDLNNLFLWYKVGFRN